MEGEPFLDDASRVVTLEAFDFIFKNEAGKFNAVIDEFNNSQLRKGKS